MLWPAVRRCVTDGDELTAQVEDEHQQINDLTTDIERLRPGNPEREVKIRRVFSPIRQHSGTRRTSSCPGCRTP